jgi:hypothetical protein
MFWRIMSGNIVTDVFTHKAYRFTDQNTWVHVAPDASAALWAEFFSPDVVTVDTDLWRQCYLFLKTCPGFENVTDL